ncbi:cysteine desulfurase family protein [Brevibacterium yomogidense]|uniref:cysteine desulfurase family protein n=1 Tax=Brevibacterium yomogidense TaxID=946573 RepID=UPI0018DFEFD2
MRTYFDYAATSPLHDEVLAAYTDELRRVGNASSLHAEGQSARMRMEAARGRIARAVGAEPAEVVLTSGGTEADNLALKGIHAARNAQGVSRPRVLVSTIEHHAVLEPAEHLESLGVDVVWLPVDRQGKLDVQAFRDAVDEDPSAVSVISVMLANNEIGTVQPLEDVVAHARAHGIPVHTDAVQALGQIPLDFRALGVDAMSLSAHKVGGPVGVGALVLGRHLAPVPILHGGGQERSVRSGTLDVAGATAFAAAAELAASHITDGTAARMADLRDRLAGGIRSRIPDAILTGAGGTETDDPDGEHTGTEHTGTDRAGRLPGNLHVVFPGCEGDSLLFLLDASGFATSTGSACQAGVSRPSHVLLACGFDEDQARSTQRFSLGPDTTVEQIDALLDVLPDIVTRSRRAGMVSASPRWAETPDAAAPAVPGHSGERAETRRPQSGMRPSAADTNTAPGGAG